MSSWCARGGLRERVAGAAHIKSHGQDGRGVAEAHAEHLKMIER